MSELLSRTPVGQSFSLQFHAPPVPRRRRPFECARGACPSHCGFGFTLASVVLICPDISDATDVISAVAGGDRPTAPRLGNWPSRYRCLHPRPRPCRPMLSFTHEIAWAVGPIAERLLLQQIALAATPLSELLPAAQLGGRDRDQPSSPLDLRPIIPLPCRPRWHRRRGSPLR
jgi:hypothetical protein